MVGQRGADHAPQSRGGDGRRSVYPRHGRRHRGRYPVSVEVKDRLATLLDGARCWSSLMFVPMGQETVYHRLMKQAISTQKLSQSRISYAHHRTSINAWANCSRPKSLTAVGTENIHRIRTHHLHAHTTILQRPSRRGLEAMCREVLHDSIRRILAATSA
jgi:hypothetical protein